MIKLENVVLASPEQMEFIIEGMRNPMNSWDRSDSGYGCDSGLCSGHCAFSPQWCGDTPRYVLGENDYTLMQKLSNAGTDHRKFMRMMPVYVRITAPLYWWKEFDTYKVGTVVNSCSTMHKIQEKEFTLDDFSTEHLTEESFSAIEDAIVALNDYRAKYIKQSSYRKSVEHSNNDGHISGQSGRYPMFGISEKDLWWQLIQLLPSSYNQTRNVMMNYEVLANIYKSRKDHKLDEWKVHETPEEHKFRNKDFSSGKWGFCDWIETLPYSELIVGEKED